jgi:hypothetical protein
MFWNLENINDVHLNLPIIHIIIHTKKQQAKSRSFIPIMKSAPNRRISVKEVASTNMHTPSHGLFHDKFCSFEYRS